jgi:hypothetical protein
VPYEIQFFGERNKEAFDTWKLLFKLSQELPLGLLE